MSDTPPSKSKANYTYSTSGSGSEFSSPEKPKTPDTPIAPKKKIVRKNSKDSKSIPKTLLFPESKSQPSSTEVILGEKAKCSFWKADDSIRLCW